MEIKGFGSISLMAMCALMFSGYSVASNPVEWEKWDNSTSPPTLLNSGTIYEEVPAPPPYQYALTDVFAGPATLSKTCFGIPITLNCTLTVGGRLWQPAQGPAYQDLQLDVTSAVSSGGGGGLVTCSDVTFSNFPWSGQADHGLLPTSSTDDTTITPFTISGIQVNTPCGSCSGSVGVTYTNANDGTFTFNGTLGSCSVNGSNITQVDGYEYDVWHP